MSDALTLDGLQSLTTGMGTLSHDKRMSAGYVQRFLSDVELEAAYDNSWIAETIVNVPALDALRKWRSWQGEADQITAIEQEEKRLAVASKMLMCKTASRLFGGAALIIGEPTANPEEPIEPDLIQKGGLQYLSVMMRSEVSFSELEDDPASPYYGKPRMYEFMTKQNGVLVLQKVHPSRMVVQVGSPSANPWQAHGMAFGWGKSSLQAPWEAVQNADSTAANVASLVYEANVDVFGIPNLTTNLASSAGYEQTQLKRFALANLMKSLNRALIRDKDEEYDRKAVSFANLPEVMQKMLDIAAGAAKIPKTIFMGEAPGGLSSEGSGEERAYYDRIESIQTLEIGPAMHILDECIIRSALGDRPEEIWYEWRPLQQLTEGQQAEIAERNANTIHKLNETGLIPREALSTSAVNMMTESGAMPGLEQAYDDATKGGEFDLGEGDDELSTREAGE